MLRNHLSKAKFLVLKCIFQQPRVTPFFRIKNYLTGSPPRSTIREKICAPLGHKGAIKMSRRVKLVFELPDELFTQLREEEIETKVKDSLVTELLREHRLSQGKAAELLGLDRDELFDLMARSEEHTSELQSQFHLVC